MQKITPCLSFDTEGEEAATFYTSVFPNSGIVDVWLKDKFGVSWQIVPTALPKLLGDPDPEKSQRVMQSMLTMRKIEIDALERAAAQA